jgi:hypothetical protein
LPNADAVFFVTDSKETLISADEVEMLKKIQEITPYIFFVQTKCDLEEEEHCINWKERNEEILEEALNVPGKDLKYFNVSSELKLDADESHDRELLDLSGYPAILDFIQHKLLPNKERHISLKLKKNLASFSTTAEHKLEGKLQIYRAQTKSNFEALEDKYKSAKSTFDKWQSGKQQDVLSDLLRQSQDVVRNTRQRLLEDLNASRFGPIVAPIISEIRSSSMNANTVYDKAKWYGNRSENHCKEIVSKVIQAYAQQMNHVVADLAASLKSDLLFDSEVNIAVDSKSSESLKPDNDPGGWILGAFIKGSVAATVANLLLAPFSPFNLALTLFSGGAFVAGALKGKQGYENTKKDRVVARLEQLLETTVKDVQIKALHKFDALAATSSQTLVDSVKTIADVYQQEVDEAMKELEEVRNAPKGKFDAKAKTLEAKLAQVKALIKKLGPFAAAE